MKGKRIVVTRAAHQAEEFSEKLVQRGAIPLLYPCIEFELPQDTSVIDAALAGDFDWLIVTSATVVNVLEQRCKALGIGQLQITHVAAVGSASAKMVRERLNLNVSVMPEVFDGQSLVDALPSLKGKTVFLPMSDRAGPAVWEQLVAQGADVMGMTAYHNVMGRGGVDLPRLLGQQAVDAVTFTSPSTVENCLIRLGDGARYLKDVCIACIGPTTAMAAQSRGLSVTLIADEHTIDGLIFELERFFA
jgi:uroporphyrinogen-III synthase